MGKFLILTSFFISLLLFKVEAQEKWAFVSIDSAGKSSKGILSESGKLLVPVQFESIRADKNYFFVKKNSFWGCYKNGKNIIPVVYDAIGEKVSENLIKVKKNGKWGFVDLSNNIIVPFQYDFACNFYSGIAFVKMGERNFHINQKSEVIDNKSMESNYCPEELSEDVGWRNQFKDDLLVLNMENGKYGVIEKKSQKVIIPYEYDEVKGYYNNIITVRKGSQWGAYHDTGVIISNAIFDSISNFGDQ